MNEASDKLSRIRDILIGNEISSLDDKIQQAQALLEEKLNQSLATMQNSNESANEHFKQLYEGLTREIADEKQTQIDRTQELGAMIRALSNNMESQQNTFKTLLDQWNDQMEEKLKSIVNDQRQQAGILRVQLQEQIEKMEESKLDKDILADFFEGLANSLRKQKENKPTTV